MDEATNPRRGRPPAPTPTMPLFLGAARTRVKEEVIMSSSTAREMRAYIDWAGGRAMMPDEEALIRTIDHALMDYFRNDKAWQLERADYLGAGSSVSKGAPTRHEASAPLPPGAKSEGRPAAPSAAGKAVG